MRTLTTRSIPSQAKILNANVRREYSLDWRGKVLLNEEGIAASPLPSGFKSVEVTALNAIYCGVGIRNSKGGMEFFSGNLSSTPFTVKRAAITYIPRVEGHRSDKCCAFADFMDYLAFLTLRNVNHVPLPECDCIIMGAQSNFVELLKVCKKYDKIYHFFPNTIIGRTMALTINDECKHAIKDCSEIYVGQANLHQYVKNIV